MNPLAGVRDAYYFMKGVTVGPIKNNATSISGFRTNALIDSIRNHWGSTKIGSNIFRKIQSHTVELSDFFLPDLQYILKTLLTAKGTRVPKRTISDVLTQLQANTWLKKTTSEDFRRRFNYARLSDISPLWQPLPHQMNFLKHYEEMSERYSLRGYILGAAPGSGKTATNIYKAIICGSDVHVYFVPKNSVIDVWRKTLKGTTSPHGYGKEGIFTHPENEPTWDSLCDKPLTADYKHYVFHYEQIEAATTFFKKNFVGKNVDVSLDESHNFNEMKSSRTQMFIDFCKMVNAQDVIWSSGTPLKAMGSEVIPILWTIDPFFDRFAAERFKAIFGLSSSRALDILKHRLGYMTFKIQKEDVVKNEVHTYDVKVKIPNGSDYTLEAVGLKMSKFIEERTKYYAERRSEDHAMYFEILRNYEKGLNSAQRKEYSEYINCARTLNAGYDPQAHEYESGFCNRYEKNNIIPAIPSADKENFRHVKSIYKYVHFKIKGEALGRILGKARMQCNVDMLNGWDKYKAVERPNPKNQSPDRASIREPFETSIHDIIEQAPSKTILFTSYVEVVDKVFDVFTHLGARPLRVYGDTNSQLPAILKVFTSDKMANPLVATLKSLSTAVPMVMASDVVFLNTPFRQYEYEQASSRVNRLGQVNVVSLWNVILDTGEEPNLSTRSSDIMNWSSAQVDAMLGITATTVTDYALEGDTVDMLEAGSARYDDEGRLVDTDGNPLEGAREIQLQTGLPGDVDEEYKETLKQVGEHVATEATVSVYRRSSNNPTPGTNMAKGKWTW